MAELGTVTQSMASVSVSNYGTDTRHLFWIDLEMSGLTPATARVLGIAIVITDNELYSRSPVLSCISLTTCSSHDDEQSTHASGSDRAFESIRAERGSSGRQMLAFSREHVPRGCHRCAEFGAPERRFSCVCRSLRNTFCTVISMSSPERAGARCNPELIPAHQSGQDERSGPPLIHRRAQVLPELPQV